jgi:hypothetical protein
MKVRLAGLILMVLLTVSAVLAWLHLLVRIMVLADDRAREMLCGLDLFGNTGLFNGSRWETISSHTGRELPKRTWWAVCLSAGLDVLQKGHCAGANALEQPLLDVIKKFESKGS